MLNIALPKGRLGEKVYAMFAGAGFECPELLENSRKLIFDNPEAGVRLLVTHGDKVSAGQPLAQLCAPTRPERLPAAAQLVQEAIAVSSSAPAPKPLILEVVE